MCQNSLRLQYLDKNKWAMCDLPVLKCYSDKFKESVIKKMMPDNPTSIQQLCRETGVSDVTLYKWRKLFRNKGVVVPGDKSKSENWTAGDKLSAVIDTACFNEVELSEFCRSKGLYREQITQWKIEALSGYEKSTQVEKSQSLHRREDKQKIIKLKREQKRLLC